jgi:hypothetical protein
MKLLFDQNLSPRLPRLLADIYAGGIHVREVGLRDAVDAAIWDYAKLHGSSSFPKIQTSSSAVCCTVARRNLSGCVSATAPSRRRKDLLRKHSAAIHTFDLDNAKSHLMLP